MSYPFVTFGVNYESMVSVISIVYSNRYPCDGLIESCSDFISATAAFLSVNFPPAFELPANERS